MASRRRIVRQKETYRFSATQTISDHPLLIGELLRRGELRLLQQARFRAWIRDMVSAIELRTRWRSGSGREALGRFADDGRWVHDGRCADDPAAARTNDG